ncbi:MAG: GNAT family N-acetyltransferase [Nocardioidaceae bacterium]
MQVGMTALTHLSEKAVAEWQALSDQAVEANPFYEPGFVLPAAAALARPGVVQLVTIHQAGRLVAAFPATTGRWRQALPALSSWRHKYCFLGTPLVHRDVDAGAVFTSLLHALPAATGRRTLILEQMGADGPLHRCLLEAATASGWTTALNRCEERAALRRRDDSAYLDHLSRKRTKEFGRLRRRLADEVGAAVAAVDVSDDRAAPDRFMRIEASGWKGLRETAMASTVAEATMFRSICANFEARGQLQMLELSGGGHVMAALSSLQSGDGQFMFKIGFDEKFAHFSPGILLLIDNVDLFHAEGLDWIDSCAASDNPMINSLWPDRRTVSTLALTSPGLLGTGVRAGLRAANRVNELKRRS